MMCNKTFLALALIGGLVKPALAQVDSLALRYAETITEEELRQHLTTLASDAFLGRDTGKEGQKMAAAYLKNEFVQAGIPPVTAPDPATITEGYFQPYDLIEDQSGSISIEGSGRTLIYKEELVYFNESMTGDMPITEVVHLGGAEGIPKDGLNGAVVLVNASGMGQGLDVLGTLRTRLDAVRAAGAALILVSVPSLATMVEGMHLSGTTLRLAYQVKTKTPTSSGAQMIMVDEAAMNELLRTTTMAGLGRKKKARRIPLVCTVKVRPGTSTITAENVLAYIEGSDKKEELLVITAHYDHIGVENGVVYNGADDDGTGTVALIEIAEAFAQAKAEGHGPRRSVLVMPVSGEEKGLLGSRYYSDHPVFPLENTIADLNIDMIGRTDSSHSTAAPYVYIIGSDRLSSELHAANEAANANYTKLDLDYRFNAESDPNRFYYRSDHYNFARKGIPSIFYFSGVHEDYHQPGDDVEKIRFDLLRQRTMLVFHTAWILAGRESRPTVDKPLKP